MKELKKVLGLHEKWLNSEQGGIRADLSNTDLRNVDLRGTNLSYADLIGTNLSYANLIGTNLNNANLIGTNLNNANLIGTNLNNADLRDIKYNSLSVGLNPVCPEEGSYIGYKKAKNKKKNKEESVIVKLLITEDTLRSSATTRKCRCSKAKVLSITSLDGTRLYSEAYSDWDNTFIYRVGEIVEVKDFDTNRWNECSTGIHHFITRKEAIEY